mmetsp:Transcript_21496/g.50096  ORF Transcript_21496/g.50096 Transcript_21496/m.50096 type:complete len:147 (-) Transcript_21496:14-454(-)
MGSGASRKSHETAYLSADNRQGSSGSMSSLSTVASLPRADPGEKLGKWIATGTAPNDLLQKAACRLIRAEPHATVHAKHKDFRIPEASELPVTPTSSEEAQPKPAKTRGIPLRYLAGCQEVAWEYNGRLQPLIGAQHRTGDPDDVW